MNIIYSDEKLKTMVRLDLQVQLQSHELDLPNFGLQPMTDEKNTTCTRLNYIGLNYIEYVVI